jgi:Xaa-Pro aminopeptidase
MALPTRRVEDLHHLLRHLHELAALAASPLASSLLVSRQQQAQPGTMTDAALRAVLNAGVEQLAQMAPGLADLLRGRFWERLTVAQMVRAGRPEQQSERRFYAQQQQAIERLAILLAEAEARCQQQQAQHPLPARLPLPSYPAGQGEFHMNLTQIQTYLQAHDLDGWLLYFFQNNNPIALSVAGLRNGGTRRWFLWLPAQGEPQWLIHAIEGNTFVHIAPEMQGPMQRYAGWRQLAELLGQIVTGQPGQPLRVAMEYSPGSAIPYVSRVDAGTLEMVQQATGATIVSSADLTQLALAVLSPATLDGHRAAARHCLAVKESAFAFIAERLRSGMALTEWDVYGLICEQFAARGMDPEFTPIVAVNRNAADPHYAPSATHHSSIQVGDLVLIDLWNRVGRDPYGCLADITWTAFCGNATPPKVQQIFAVVAQGRDAAVALIEARLSAGEPVYGYEVDDACRAVITAAGYGPNFFHRTGHSLGWLDHFLGVNIDNLETQDRRQLLPGLLFTIEPGIYLPDCNFDDSPMPKGLGIRSEINCTVHADRLEVTTLPMQRSVTALLA